MKAGWWAAAFLVLSGISCGPGPAEHPEPREPAGKVLPSANLPRGGSFRPVRPKHYVYVIDRSGSMLHTFDAVKHDVIKSIDWLDVSWEQDFHVILWADGPPLELAGKALLPATDENRKMAVAFLREMYPKGMTDPLPALGRAFDVLEKAQGGGKVIFLLTDSQFPDPGKMIALFRARNAKKEVEVYTYLYGERTKEAEETMRKIASENGGQYRFVSAEE